MPYLTFELTGDIALWRNPYESMGAYSSLGPAPSAIAGLIGAALGFAAPRSVAAEITKESEEKRKNLNKGKLFWPVSEELLKWEKGTDYSVACRWMGQYPRRISWNVNGIKAIDPSAKGDSSGYFQMQQQVISSPSYEVSLRLRKDEAERVAKALKEPAFPLFLGTGFCRAIVRNIRVTEEMPSADNWAYKMGVAFGEATPFSCHVIDAEKNFERISMDGYWIYPTDASMEKHVKDPFVRGYCELGEK